MEASRQMAFEQLSSRMRFTLPVLEKIAKHSTCTEDQLQDLNVFYTLTATEAETLFGTRSYTKIKPLTHDIKTFVLDIIGFLQQSVPSDKEKKSVTSKALLLTREIRDVLATMKEERGKSI